MATYKFSVVSALLCIVYLVNSAKIWGGSKENSYDTVDEAEFSESINGYNSASIRYIYLYRLVEPAKVPTLTVTNFKALRRLEIEDISLENVPIFKNTAIGNIVITGNRIKSLPANAFADSRPQHLNLTGNEIANIADNAIRKGARFVILACNKLTSFSQAWFQEPSDIQILILSGNQIVHIEEQAFSRMTGLQTLEMNNNRIANIGNGAFSAAIRHLFLDFNEIGQLTADMFATRVNNMWTLYIHHNKLSYLSEALFVKLKPEKVILDGNPWQCQCLREIEKWLRDLKLTRVYLTFRRDDPSCVVPGSFENVCVHAVDTKLEQLYMDGLSPVPNCVKPCGPCANALLYSPALASFQYTPT